MMLKRFRARRIYREAQQSHNSDHILQYIHEAKQQQLSMIPIRDKILHHHLEDRISQILRDEKTAIQLWTKAQLGTPQEALELRDYATQQGLNNILIRDNTPLGVVLHNIYITKTQQGNQP